jgi:hypothetical protein
MSEDIRYKMHREIVELMHDTYLRKNKRYGNSVTKTFEEYGPVSFCLRLDDKLNRAKQILLYNEQDVSEGDPKDQVESVVDTLMDLANYAVIAIIELKMKAAAEASGNGGQPPQR